MPKLEALPSIHSALKTTGKHPKAEEDSLVAVISGSMTLGDVANTIESLTFDDGSFSTPECRTLKLSGFDQLTDVVVGNNVGYYTKKVMFVGMESLKRLVIKDFCFTQVKSRSDEIPCRKARLGISNCPALKSFEIGVFSFADFAECSFKGTACCGRDEQTCRVSRRWTLGGSERTRSASPTPSSTPMVRKRSAVKCRSALAQARGGGRLLPHGRAPLPL